MNSPKPDIFVPTTMSAGDDILIILSGGTPNADVNLRITYTDPGSPHPWVEDIAITLNENGRAEIDYTVLDGDEVTFSINETTTDDDVTRQL